MHVVEDILLLTKWVFGISVTLALLGDFIHWFDTRHK